jgi:phosphoglycerate dehydrogenase-like enzyme
MARIAVLDDYQGCALHMADWTSLLTENEIEVFRDHVSDQDVLVERLKGFEIIVAMRDRSAFPRSLLNRLPRLKLLVATGRRHPCIDLQAATDRGILVCDTDGSYATVELTWGLILSLLRHIPMEDSATRHGQWQISIGMEARGRILGVLGLGQLGSRVATIGRAFGMSVQAWSPHLTAERAVQTGSEFVSKDELLSSADIVTIHMVLSDRTRGLIGSRELGLMKPTAYLVNTSRGPIVDEKALVHALRNRTIAGAALDVFDEEPLPLDHPLRRLDNTVVTPHLGFVTEETYRVFYGQSVEDIQAFLKGSPIRTLNKV